MTDGGDDSSDDPGAARHIASYHDLTQAEVLADLASVDTAQLAIIRSFEEAGRRRPVILNAIARLVAPLDPAVSGAPARAAPIPIPRVPDAPRAAPLPATPAAVDQMSKLMAVYSSSDKQPGSPSLDSPAQTGASESAAQPRQVAAFTAGQQADSDASPGSGWWFASDRRWYPPEARPPAQRSPLNSATPSTNVASEPSRTGTRHSTVAIIAVVAVLAVMAAAVVLNRKGQPNHVATAPAPAGSGAGRVGPPVTSQPSVTPIPAPQPVSLKELGGFPWTDLGHQLLTPDQLATSAPCPGQPAGWGQDLSGAVSEFSYRLQADGNEAGHLLSAVVRTSSAEAAAQRLVYRQSDTNVACLEQAARASLTNSGVAQVVSLSTTRASMQSVEPAAMWRVKANLSRADGHRFVVFQDAIRIVDGPYLAVIIVNGCGCIGANPNPSVELVPGEAQAIVTIGRHLRDAVGH